MKFECTGTKFKRAKVKLRETHFPGVLGTPTPASEPWLLRSQFLRQQTLLIKGHLLGNKGAPVLRFECRIVIRRNVLMKSAFCTGIRRFTEEQDYSLPKYRSG